MEEGVGDVAVRFAQVCGLFLNASGVGMAAELAVCEVKEVRPAGKLLRFSWFT